jgi:hypothetical protein
MNALRELDPQRTPARRVGAARIREADTVRRVYELWHTAGVLPVGAAASCGRVTPVGSSGRGVEDGDAWHG